MGTVDTDIKSWILEIMEQETETTASVDGPFPWTTQEQGRILSAYFVGYFLTQIPGGRMAELYSGKYVFLVAVLMNTLGTLLSPVLAYWSYSALIVARIFEGMGGGFTFPALNVLIASWSPPQERSVISSINFSGASLGTVMSMMSSGVINELCGWEWIFYIQGGLSVLWCVAWVALVTDTPDKHMFISKEEKDFISASKPKQVSADTQKPPVPWLKIVTSVPFLALAVAHFCNNFGWYMLLVELPLFAKQGLEVDNTINTIMSSVPFFANWLFSVLYSKGLDALRNKGIISTTIARKISVGMASVVPSLCLLAIIFAGSNVPVVVTFTILAVMFYGSMFSGVFSNQTDLSPNFAGTLMALTNMLATIPGIIVPLIVGTMTQGTMGLGPWHTVFYMTVGLLSFEFILFTILGKGEVQPWNDSRMS